MRCLMGWMVDVWGKCWGLFGEVWEVRHEALVQTELGNYQIALNLHKEEQLCHNNSDKLGLATSLGNQGILHYHLSKTLEAMRLFKKQESICRRMGDLSGLQASLGNQAQILREAHDLEAAIALHAEEERLCRQIGERRELHICLGNQALIKLEQGNFDDALMLLEEKEKLAKTLGDHAGLAHAWINLAGLFLRINQPSVALGFAEKSFHLATKHKLVTLGSEIIPILKKIQKCLSSMKGEE